LIVIEGILADFNGESSRTVFFSLTHKTTPVITVTPEGAIADVNLYVESVDSTKVVLKSSEDFSGKVHIQVWSK